MKKGLLLITALMICAHPAISSVSNKELMTAISKYKNQNYVGCLQDMQQIIKKDPSNAVAQYYYAISNVSIGRKDAAIEAYTKVISLDTTQTLKDYSQKGLDCLQKPESCSSSETDLDKFINGNSSTFSKDVSKKIQERDLEQMKNQINDSVKRKSELPANETNAVTPTNDEIANAVKTLSRAGVNVFQNTNQYNPMNSMYQSPEYAQLQMLTGNTSNNNDTFTQMLPFLMNQSNGTKNNVPPEVIKSMMMSSLMGDFSFANDDNNKGN